MNKEDSVDSLKYYIKRKQIDDMYKSTKEYGRIDFVKKIVEIQEENTNLKQVLNKIRKYIAKDIQECTYGQVPKYQDILQIIDKVLGDEK